MKIEKLVRNIYIWNYAHAFRWAYEWENLIVADVKISKRDFDFYCHLVHKISIVNSKFRNASTNILFKVLNSRLLKPTMIKFSFMFIEFRYNLSIRGRWIIASRSVDDMNHRYSAGKKRWIIDFVKDFFFLHHRWIRSTHLFATLLPMEEPSLPTSLMYIDRGRSPSYHRSYFLKLHFFPFRIQEFKNY